MSETRVPRSFAVLAVSMAVIALIVFTLSWRISPMRLNAYILLLAVFALASESLAAEIGGYSISLAFPLTISAIVLGGPTAGAIVAAISDFQPSRMRTPWGRWTSLYNAGQLVLVCCVSGWVLLGSGGRTIMDVHGALTQLGTGDFPAVLPGIIAMVFVCASGNVVLVAVGISLLRRLSLVEVLASAGAHLPSLLALGLVGVLIAQVVAVSLAALPLFAFPFVVAQQLYQRFFALREAYTDTMRSLIRALEAKDPYTRGHSERVAAYSRNLAERAGWDPRAIDRLEQAALLHDLGKLGIPGSLLRKEGALTDDEFELVRQHPIVGARMVERIPHLSGLARSVGQHHERLDGTGYPVGASGEGILPEARVLAIADSYDAMTTNRSYRAALTALAASEELRRCAGSGLDAAMVELFLETQSAHESLASGEPSPEPYAQTVRVEVP